MAYGGKAARTNILLGFPDEYIDDNSSDFRTNKIGGKPDWCASPPPPQPKCQLCGSSQPLVTQIYAPLDNSVYHRTLYIFCCVQPACWNKQRSWVCYRSQLKDNSMSDTTTVSTTTTTGTDWLDDADDWGDDDNGNVADNGNLAEPLTSPSSPDSPTPQGAVGGVPQSRRLDNIHSDTREELSLKSLNIGAVTGEDPNANVGETVMIGGGGVSAEIEHDDEVAGCVSVDLPEVDTTNIPKLFQSQNAVIPSTGIEFTPMYIWVGDEQPSPQLSQHELNLLKQFKKENEMDGGGGGGGGGDVYEKCIPVHGDEFSHKFISTVQKNPGQILRYGRNSSEPPLLFQPLELKKNETSESLKKCSHCSSSLKFEMQLLPTLVTYLESQDIDGTPVEFGTLLVYSCANSCWSDGEVAREETIILQQETM